MSKRRSFAGKAGCGVNATVIRCTYLIRCNTQTPEAPGNEPGKFCRPAGAKAEPVAFREIRLGVRRLVLRCEEKGHPVGGIETKIDSKAGPGTA
jgi:hypothetical protein